MDSEHDVANLSLRYFRSGYFCSEAILRAFNELYNLGLDEKYYKIASGFGSGMGESGCSCGAITGSVMVLGLIVGRSKNYQSEKVVYEAVRELHDTFRANHGALCCRILTKNVIWNSAEHKTLCEDYVLDAAQISCGIINRKLHFPPFCTEKLTITKRKIAIKKNPCALLRYIFGRKK
ncbi:MAG: hypothetical protein Ta2B_01500 [Termitinemataceae bacterium]|nr:MAG: hypothetical protein Ta2B_01500 [Termitinemataceae bacterium]